MKKLHPTSFTKITSWTHTEKRFVSVHIMSMVYTEMKLRHWGTDGCPFCAHKIHTDKNIIHSTLLQTECNCIRTERTLIDETQSNNHAISTRLITGSQWKSLCKKLTIGLKMGVFPSTLFLLSNEGPSVKGQSVSHNCPDVFSLFLDFDSFSLSRVQKWFFSKAFKPTKSHVASHKTGTRLLHLTLLSWSPDQREWLKS